MRDLRDLPEKQPAHLWVRHPEQFTVFSLAEFDDQTGQFSNVMAEAVINLKVLFAQGGRPVAVDSVQKLEVVQ